VDDLQRFVDAGPDEGRAQDGGPVDDPLPRLGEPILVGDAVEHERRLLDVHALPGLGQAVEDHAALHRRERVDVLDRPAVAGQFVHSGLIEAGQREVGRRPAARVRGGAVGDDLPQRGQHPAGQVLDRAPVVQAGDVGPG
jgi:hypothetical protein